MCNSYKIWTGWWLWLCGESQCLASVGVRETCVIHKECAFPPAPTNEAVSLEPRLSLPYKSHNKITQWSLKEYIVWSKEITWLAQLLLISVCAGFKHSRLQRICWFLCYADIWWLYLAVTILNIKASRKGKSGGKLLCWLIVPPSGCLYNKKQIILQSVQTRIYHKHFSVNVCLLPKL